MSLRARDYPPVNSALHLLNTRQFVQALSANIQQADKIAIAVVHKVTVIVVHCRATLFSAKERDLARLLEGVWPLWLFSGFCCKNLIKLQLSATMIQLNSPAHDYVQKRTEMRKRVGWRGSRTGPVERERSVTFLRSFLFLFLCSLFGLKGVRAEPMEMNSGRSLHAD